jgi:quinoprotein glucose dehydrogenase
VGEITIDAGRGIAYFPTGSATFDLLRRRSTGANLLRIVCSRSTRATGKRLWHFQNVIHDLWDYDNTSAPQLTTIKQNGKTIPVVAMAGKTWFSTSSNRVTANPCGRSKSVPCRPGRSAGRTGLADAAVSDQPTPFARQKFTVDDINPFMLTDAEREQFKQRIAAARNEGLFTPIGFGEAIHMPATTADPTSAARLPTRTTAPCM